RFPDRPVPPESRQCLPPSLRSPREVAAIRPALPLETLQFPCCSAWRRESGEILAALRWPTYILRRMGHADINRISQSQASRPAKGSTIRHPTIQTTLQLLHQSGLLQRPVGPFVRILGQVI